MRSHLGRLHYADWLGGSFTALIVCRVILGWGRCDFPTATRALADWFPAEKRGFAQGITHSFAHWEISLLRRWWHCSSAGFLAMSFMVLGVVSLIWSVVWWFYFRDNPPHIAASRRKNCRKYSIYATKMERKKDPVPWKALTFRMAPVTLVYFCYGWTLWLYLTWLPQFFMHGYKLNLKNSALFSSGVFLAGVIGDTVGGLVSDRILIKTGDRNKARRNLVIAGFVLSLLFMIPILRSHNLTIVALCLSAAFFFAEFTIGPFWAIPMDIAPRFSGSPAA